MQYRPDILSTYGQLFQDAHGELMKEAGFFSRLGGGIKNFFGAPGRARRAEEALGKAEQQAARQQKAIDDAAHRMGLAEADVAASRAAERKAKEEALRSSKQLEQYGSPEKIKHLEDRARAGTITGLGGAGLGVAGLAAAPFAYGAGKSTGEADKTRTRNIAFGAGAAAGLAAPQLVRGLGHVARGVSRTGLYPELEGLGGY